MSAYGRIGVVGDDFYALNAFGSGEGKSGFVKAKRFHVENSIGLIDARRSLQSFDFNAFPWSLFHKLRVKYFA